jgi:hypothetical protein
MNELNDAATPSRFQALKGPAVIEMINLDGAPRGPRRDDDTFAKRQSGGV